MHQHAPAACLREQLCLLVPVPQEWLGLELAVLAEDPAGASAAAIAAEAHARLSRQPAGIQQAPAAQPGAAQSTNWIAPAPASVKLRLFCLPYAGGVSENVFAR